MSAPDNDKTFLGRGTVSVDAEDNLNPFADSSSQTTDERNTDRFQPGDIIDNIYVVERKLGQGGMGQVYLARHRNLNSLYAVKVLDCNHDEALWQRFTNEARLIARLNHPNIVKVHNMGVHQETMPYYAMDYIEGRTLADLLKTEGRLSIKHSLQIFIQVCRCLSFAHSHDIVHRDIKPANIMLTGDNYGPGCIKVLDFGLAKFTADISSQELTRTGEIFGSPSYMSPEQALGSKTDARSDIYSTTVSLYETLTGVLPFSGKTSIETLLNVQEEAAPTLRTASGGQAYPQDLEAVICHGLEKKPRARYQTMEQFGADLEALAADRPAELARKAKDIALQHAVSKTPVPKPIQKADNAHFSTAAALLAVLLLLGLLATIAIIGGQGNWRKASATAAIANFHQKSQVHFGPVSQTFRQSSSQGRLFLFRNCPDIGYIVEISRGSRILSADKSGRLYLPPGSIAYLSPSEALIGSPDQLSRFRDGDMDGLILDTSKPITECLKVAAHWPHLKYLEIMDAPLGMADLQIIASFKNLETLRLNTINMDPVQVAALPILPNLDSVEVSRCSNAGPIIERLTSSSKLTDLVLDSSRLDHSLVKKIARLRGIRSLSLQQTGIDDEDIKTLRGLHSLNVLTLRSNPDITSKALRDLAAIHTRALKVSHIGWSPQDISALQKLRPFVDPDPIR